MEAGIWFTKSALGKLTDDDLQEVDGKLEKF
jgi:uncharacterized protein YjbJ (UPF0337 family)